MRRNGLLFAIMLLVCSAIGFAQMNTGKISGFVTDSSGARRHKCACGGDK